MFSVVIFGEIKMYQIIIYYNYYNNRIILDMNDNTAAYNIYNCLHWWLLSSLATNHLC